jgi:hypothetical protein
MKRGIAQSSSDSGECAAGVARRSVMAWPLWVVVALVVLFTGFGKVADDD